MRKTLFADVLLPLPVEGYFTYRVPYELNGDVETGKRVVVQFGKKKIFTALVKTIHENPPKVEPKYILDVLDLQPIVNAGQFAFWEWMASYYCSTAGEVMNAALPSAFKLASETRLSLNQHISIEPERLNEREYNLLTALQSQGDLTVSEASSAIGLVKIFPVIKSLIEKGYIYTEEEVSEKYRPKIETYITLPGQYKDEELLGKVYGDLEKKSEKQFQLLVEYIHLSSWLRSDHNEVTRSALMKRIPGSTSPLNALIKKGIFEQYEKEVSRLGYKNAEALPSSITLNAVQQEAFDKIREEFREKHVVLLHGVTSSGKTELYIRMIDEVLSQGKQVLYLLPEIALTSQIINRLQKYFGNRVGVYHSRFDENERVEIWQRIAGIQPEGLASSYQVILGARSALFLPYSNLGLVIIDEEHDPSFKQHDPAPRYNARDAAIYLAGLHDAKVLLGSATPSVESYYNAVIGKFGLALLPERFGGMMMPDIRVINLKEEHKLKRMHSIFSVTLTEAIESALARKEQVILFQNRRGFSLQLLCDSCDWVPQCVQCDVSLVYHKKQNVLRCHYCGYSTRIPEECPDCGNTGIRMKGFGTEQIEEELSLIFPEASIARMDLDTTRSKYAYQRLISDFEERRIDILTGTQMITKGLDFDNVALVGILNADGIINFPDFRSFERAFQLMAQVAGRAGRKNSQGTVMIQAFNTSHPVIDLVLKHDYKGLYAQQVEERNKFRYPPIYRLIQVTLKHPDAGKLNRAADLLATALYKEFGKRVLGPEYPFVSRIKNLFLKNILLKLEKGASLPVSKQKLMDAIKLLHAQADFSTVRVQVDVDPM